MNIRKIKTRCTKQTLEKCIGICKTYSPIATKYSTLLNESEEIITFETNVLLEDFKEGEYTTDFVCTKADGKTMVRECIDKSNLCRPKNARLLDSSRNYWLSRGVTDWGIVVNE